MQGAGGVIVPPADYFPRIREICDRYDVLLIADEVITGFGRTGRWFGLEHYGVEPDIMQFAKGITSGYIPLGGIGVSDAIRDVIDGVPAEQALDARLHLLRPSDLLRGGAGEPRHHGARAAGRARRPPAARGCSTRLRTLESMDGVGHVRGQGLMAAVEVVADKATKRCSPRRVGLTQKLMDALLERGLYTRVVMDCICIAPPLVTTDAELDRLVDIVGDAIGAVVAEARQHSTPVAAR